MAILRILNKTPYKISTTVGTVKAGSGVSLDVYTDTLPIPKRLYEELERLRRINYIDYSIVDDPDIRQEIENAPYEESLSTVLDKIGEPTTGSYIDGLFSWFTKDTRIADAIYDISKMMLAVVPAKANTLIGITPTADVALYTAKIPSGLSPAWGGLTPGDTIDALIYDTVYKISLPSAFRAGMSSYPASAGILTHIINGAVGSVYDIGTNGVGTIGPIRILTLDPYNTIWLAATAEIYFIAQNIAGKIRHALSHTEAGMTNELILYYDLITTPTFSVPLTATVETPVYKWMSGVSALDSGSIIRATYTAASGIFRNVYHPTAVGTLSCLGETLINNPVDVPHVDDEMVVNETFTLGVAPVAVQGIEVAATIQKANGYNSTSNFNIDTLINTYGPQSTDKIEKFKDEDRRIVLHSGTNIWTGIPFDSEVSLVNGNAQQDHVNGLQYPDPVIYPGFSGPQEYQRFIVRNPSDDIKRGTLDIGIPYTNVAPYGTGSINILMHLCNQNGYVDIAKTAWGDGSTYADAISGVDASSGNIIGWNIGPYNLAYNDGNYRLIIIIRDDTIKLPYVIDGPPL